MTDHLCLPGTCVSNILYNLPSKDAKEGELSYSNIVKGSTKCVVAFTMHDEEKTRAFLEEIGFSTSRINDDCYFHTVDTAHLRNPTSKSSRNGRRVKYRSGRVHYEVLSYHGSTVDIRSLSSGSTFYDVNVGDLEFIDGTNFSILEHQRRA